MKYSYYVRRAITAQYSFAFFRNHSERKYIHIRNNWRMHFQ